MYNIYLLFCPNSYWPTHPLKAASKESYHATRSCDKEFQFIQPNSSGFRLCRKEGGFVQETPLPPKKKTRAVLHTILAVTAHGHLLVIITGANDW